MLIQARLEKEGDHYIIQIPSDVVEQYQLVEGQEVEIKILASSENGFTEEELKKLFEESWKQNEAGYRYLSGR